MYIVCTCHLKYGSSNVGYVLNNVQLLTIEEGLNSFIREAEREATERSREES